MPNARQAQSGTIHPRERLRRAHRRSAIGGGAILLLAIIWAFAPIDSTREHEGFVPLDRPSVEVPESDDKQSSAIDRRLFTSAKLWNPPPPPPAPEQSKGQDVRIARPNLQLIGIINHPGSGGARSAALYDPQKDRLLIVAEGEAIEPYIVASIDENLVVLKDGRHEAHLRLKREERPR